MASLQPLAPAPHSPPGANDTEIGALARPLLELPPTAAIAEVDQLFRRRPDLQGVAVMTTEGLALLTRAALQQLLIGPLGYGRAVNERRLLGDVVSPDALVLSAETSLGSAAQQLLQRDPERRYDDVLVVGAAGLGMLPVSGVFARLSEHYAHQSGHDPLTGLPNRRLLAQHLRHSPAGEAGPALLYVDLDGFKSVNDEFGHDVGDAVLVACAQRLLDAVRPDDVVARLGGDEFAVLLVDPVTDAHASAVAERLVLLAAAPFLVDGLVITVGASVGIARGGGAAEEQVDPVETLLRSADAAMYRAKRRGRGRVEHASASEADELGGLRDRGLQRRLRTALENGDLTLAYQAKYELRTGRLLEQEALARWTDQTRPVSPAVFIPVAERSGLIDGLGRWALIAACTAARTWDEQDGDGTVVAVNVSPHQLADEAFVATVAEVLRATGLAPERLCLEITETSAIEDLSATRQQLLQLRALGVRIALDDFGTGHSSLTLLQVLPLDWVKIDRSFIEDVAHDPAGAVLVRLVIEAAHSLGARVCAEGVETVEQLVQLSAMGCDAVQGFLLSVPARTPQRGPSAQLLALCGQEPAAAGTLLTAGGQLVLLCDHEGRISYASAESVHLLGYHPAELTGTLVRSHLTPASERVLPVGVPLDDLPHEPLVLQVRHCSGALVWMEARVQVVGRRDSGPELLVTAKDVTARVRAERALADRESRLAAAFDEAPIGMALTSPEGRHLKVNAALCRLLGRSEQELLRLRWQDVTHPDDRDEDDVQLRATLRGALPGYRLRKRYVRPDGREVACLLQVRVVWADGEPQYAVAHVEPVGGWEQGQSAAARTAS